MALKPPSISAEVTTDLEDEATATLTVALTRTGGVLLMPLTVHLALTDAGAPKPVRFNAQQTTVVLTFSVPRTDTPTDFTLAALLDDTIITLATVTLPEGAVREEAPVRKRAPLAFASRRSPRGLGAVPVDRLAV